jgi:Gram-negative bacterial TonB protein C-terminal
LVAEENSSGTPAIFSIEEWAQRARRAILLAPSGAPKIPRFLVQKEPAGSSLWESVKAVCARGGSLAPATFLPFRKAFVAQSGPSSSFLGVSILLHCLAIAGLIYLPSFIPERPAPLTFAERFDTPIYYDVPVKHTEKEKELPSIAPPGEASRPGEGSKPEETPKLGSAVSLGDLTVISKPLQPDNHHQTIIQPLSPPEMRITQDVKLPNVILGNLSAPRAPLTFDTSAMPKPVRADHQVAAAPAPNVTNSAQSDAVALLGANEPVVAKPLLPVALQRPILQARADSAQGAATAVPNVAGQAHGDAVTQLGANEPVIAKPLPPVALPKPTQLARANGGEGLAAAAPNVADQAHGDAVAQLGANEPVISKPLPPMALQKPVQRAGIGNGSGQGAEGAPNLSNANGLMIVSVDPSAAGSQIAVPPGNRWGDFAIAPGQGAGSPGGNRGSDSADAGTTGQIGPGGEKSVGIGSGGTGGGGGPSSASLGPISVKGSLTGANEPLLLVSSVAAEMVYPLPVAVVAKLRENRMVISAGSMGGGGLNIYGALACGKIYTIFLPMPGANWTMQYCQKSDAAAPDKPQAPARVVQLESPMVPPDPDSDSRFDFKRLPLPPEKGKNSTIVLKGVLSADGTVQNLEVFQGVLAEMDQAAELAFGRWKFKPAMRADKAVSVEILVGIPAELGAANSGGAAAPRQQSPPEKQETPQTQQQQ